MVGVLRPDLPLPSSPVFLPVSIDEKFTIPFPPDAAATANH